MTHRLDDILCGEDIQSNPQTIASFQRLASFKNSPLIRISSTDVIEVNEMAYLKLLHAILRVQFLLIE